MAQAGSRKLNYGTALVVLVRIGVR
jgi:hypothetical protein